VRCRAYPGVWSSPTAAAANPSGDAMDTNCSTSIVTAAFGADSWDANQPESSRGAAASLGVPLIGSGHWGTQYDVSPDGQHVYFIDHTPLPRPSEINVAMGWSALLK